MATFSAATVVPATICSTFVHRGASSVSCPVLGLPKMTTSSRIRCSAEKKPNNSPSLGVVPALTAMSVIAASNPAWALVDERMSTEGTGLSLGLSNNLLAWILLGVFGLIWSFYFIYTSTLDEDEDSALSL